MRNLSWDVLLWGLPFAALVSLFGEMMYDNGKAAAEREFSINKAALEAQARENLAQAQPTQEQIDTQCSAWLFATNQKDAKRRMCSGK